MCRLTVALSHLVQMRQVDFTISAIFQQIYCRSVQWIFYRREKSFFC
jgi:hypothetical protein